MPAISTSTSTSTSTASALRYTPVAMALHWLLAIGLLSAFAMGLYMSDLPVSMQKLKLFNWHKWAGITLLVLSALRLAWRLSHRPPPDLPMPPWQAKLAHLTHGLLYVLFFAIPLAGWAYSSASGYPVVWFGILPLPDFVPVDKALAHALKTVHEVLAWTMMLLVAAHVAGALKHQLIDKDGLLSRMKPGVRS